MNHIAFPLHAAVHCMLLALVAGALAAPAIAQSPFEVTGVVTDLAGTGLPGATVMVLQEADSALVSFGITRSDGAFRVDPVPEGRYLLQVTFIGFVPYTRPITLADSALDVGQIILEEAVSELDELVVRADRIPIVISRDTISYSAGAFSVPPNANVVELLRRLPGIEVDRDGTIRALGEEVQQVLVDGREFFGNDPTVATRNLPSDAIDRVQVYDRRSDVAEFTGVDDGQEQRTIDLELKEERRQGYFGNVTAGLGDLGRYDGRATVNRFNSRTQLSLISNLNNINRQGFNVRDYMSFMGGAPTIMGQGGGVSMGSGSMMGGAPISNDLATGFSTTLSGGINLNHDFSARTSLRASYMGYYLNHEQDRNVQQWELAGAGATARSEQQADQLSQQLNHRVNFNLLHTFGEGHDIRFRSNVQVSDSDLQSWTGRETLNAANVLENTTQTSLESSGGSFSGDAALTYRLRFAPARTLTAELSSSVSDRDLDSDLAALSQFNREGNLLTAEEINQLQSQLNRTLTHRQQLTYTEPLGRRQLLQFDLGHRVTSEDTQQSVFDVLDGTPRLDYDLTSAFERIYRYYTAGINFRRAVEPLALRLGVDVQLARLDGTIRDFGAAVDRSFVHLLPSATVSYQLSRIHNIELSYSASTREPSMRDLQPFADNSDPLNVYVGNPDLRPEYTHSAMLRFLFFDPFTSTNLLASLRAAYTLDRIVRARTIDERFRQTITTTNADGDRLLSGNVAFGTPIRSLGLRVNLSNTSVFNRSVEFINGMNNSSHILRSIWELRLENRNKEVFDALIGARYTFNDVRYSLNRDLNRSYVNRAFLSEVSYQIAQTWRARATFDYYLYTSGTSESARQVPLLHAELSRMVMNGRAEVKLEVRDVLNRNVGVSYSNTSTHIQEERIDTLGRYVMLRFVYNLAGFSLPGVGRISG